MMEIGKKLEKNNNNDPIHNLLSTQWREFLQWKYWWLKWQKTVYIEGDFTQVLAITQYKTATAGPLRFHVAFTCSYLSPTSVMG